jgi:hypothetical protein
MTEEPTQQIRLRSDPTAAGPKQVTPPLPPGLDPRGRSREDEPDAGAEATGVLHLDEIFAAEADTDRHVDRPSIEDAPTWTAMPVVPIRSEPYSPPSPGPTVAPPAAPPASPPTAGPPTVGPPPASPPPTAPPPHLTGPPVAPRQARSAGPTRARVKAAPGSTARRLSTDLAGAKRRTGIVLMRTDTWLRRDDNALMLMTALIACMLILLVAAVGH